jgi:hypothetical protein
VDGRISKQHTKNKGGGLKEKHRRRIIKQLYYRNK